MTQSNANNARATSAKQKLHCEPFGIPTDMFTLQEAEKVMLYVVENYDVHIGEWTDAFVSKQSGAAEPSHECWNYYGVSVANETYWCDNCSHFGGNILQSKAAVEAYLQGFSFGEKPNNAKQQTAVKINGRKAAQKKAPSYNRVRIIYSEGQQYNIAGVISLQFVEKEIENKKEGTGPATEGFVVIHTSKVQTHKKGCKKTTTEVIEIPFKNLWMASFNNPKGAEGVTDVSYIFKNGKLSQKIEHYL